LLLVALYLRRQEPRKALAAAKRLSTAAEQPAWYVLAGSAHWAAKDPMRARRAFDAALKIQPDYLPALRGLADLDIAKATLMKRSGAMRR